LAVAPVRRAARGLDERRVPRLGPERAEKRGRVVRAGADLRVVRLHDDAASLGPEALQRQDDVLEVHGPRCNTKVLELAVRRARMIALAACAALAGCSPRVGSLLSDAGLDGGWLDARTDAERPDQSAPGGHFVLRGGFLPGGV